MKLVGATNAFIRRPFLIEGILQGLLGGGLVVVVLLMIFKVINWQWPGLVYIPNELYGMILLTGLLFGFVGSIFAIKRFL